MFFILRGLLALPRMARVVHSRIGAARVAIEQGGIQLIQRGARIDCVGRHIARGRWNLAGEEGGQDNVREGGGGG